MTPNKRERLYDLLPAIQKLRDAGNGEPLRALLSIIDSQVDRIDGDIARLYDNWFIETCDEWVVPYIGDLLGVRGQYAFDEKTISMRPFVANTIGYRRRKGTLSVIERLVQDVTGWPGRAVEFFQLLATTQHLNHLRAVDLRTPDLRDTNALALIDGPFDRAMHFAEVRRIASSRGKFNIPNVGIFLWRLRAFEVDRAPAIPQLGVGPGRYTFSQLGCDQPLFNPQRTDLDPGRVVESAVPGALRARALYDESEAARTALQEAKPPRWVYFEPQRPSFRVFDVLDEIAPELIQICDLSDWATLPPAKSIVVPDPPNGPKVETTRVAVDPVLGRVAVVSGAQPKALLVSYWFGFSAPIGGGSYARPDPATDPSLTSFDVSAVDRTQLVDGGLMAALGTWVAAGRPPAMIVIHDNAIYQVPDLAVPAGGKLILRAADGMRPVLRPTAPWQLELAADAALTLNGLVVEDQPLVVTNKQASSTVSDHHLALVDCTLVPGLSLDESGTPLSPDAASVQFAAGSQGPLILTIARAIVGRLDLRAGPCTLAVTDTIVDGCGGTPDAIGGAGDTTIDRVTIFGSVTARSVEASNVLFDGTAIVERTQIGCVRFSFVATGSQLPRRYMCQPDRALDGAAIADAPLIRERMKPSYTSKRYGNPCYAQLDAFCPDEIKTGAADGAEMGAFQMLQQPQRMSNLAAALADYLRFGVEAGTFLVT